MQNEEIAERLRNLDLKMNQIIAMNNENRMMLTRIADALNKMVVQPAPTIVAANGDELQKLRNDVDKIRMQEICVIRAMERLKDQRFRETDPVVCKDLEAKLKDLETELQEVHKVQTETIAKHSAYGRK